VLALQRDMVMTRPGGHAGGRWATARCCRVERPGGVQVVLISRRSQAMGTDLFTQLGCDLAAQRMIVVKSSQHFRAAYAPLARAGAVLRGARLGDIRPAAACPTAIRRPKWPLDLPGDMAPIWRLTHCLPWRRTCSNV
jgi:microcystin degradation protein MlrC